MKTIFSRLLVISLFVFGSAVADTSTTDVLWFADGSSTGGNSHLTRMEDKLLATVEVADLKPGDAVTLWWVVFNNPGACIVPYACGDPDFAGDGIETAQIGVANASGNIVKSNGTFELGAVLRMGESDDHQVLFGAGFGDHVLTGDPDDVEVHFVIQNHGKGRGGEKLREQVTYFEANCTPKCEDVQFAVHRAP